MIEKAKKVYESPSMKVYEIGSTQILSASDPTPAAATIEGFGNDETFEW